MVEFRLTMTSTCTHKESIFHYNTYKDVHWQWEQYQDATATLEPLLAPFHQSWIDMVSKEYSRKADQQVCWLEWSSMNVD